MALELTTKFKGISTSPAARAKCQTAEQALKRCYSSLNYIARDNASGNVAWAGLHDADGSPAQTANDARLLLRRRFRNEVKKGGLVGRRIATTGIVSLPNRWPDEVIKSAMERLAVELAPPGSQASVLIIQHIDKTNNAHLHFVAVDGVESIEAAKRRAKPSSQRVRRQNVQRFNERGAPKRWRKRIADVLNETAKKHDVAGVEWRSFKERGLRREAIKREDVGERARKARKGQTQTLKSIADLFNGDDLEDNLSDLWNTAAKTLTQTDDLHPNKGGEQRQRE